MVRRSFFWRNFISYSMLILVSVMTATLAFFYQVDRYMLTETQGQLRRTAMYLADQTAMILDDAPEETVALYRRGLLRTVSENGVTIIVTDPYGTVQLWADTDGITSGSGDSLRVNSRAAQRVRLMGYYSEMGTLGVLDGDSYIVGAQCRNEQGDIAALVFVAAYSAAISKVMHTLSNTALFVMLITLIAALILSYYISQRMTRPLKTMANAAREFAAGNFAVRVSEDSRCEEIDELSIAFNNMANDLAKLEELTRGFIGNVSHEFKTPMTTIGGFVDGMIDGTIPLEQRDKYLRTISEEVKRLSRMVTRMLDAAKIQSGELILSPAPFDFSEMASQILFSFEQKIEQKGIEVDAELDDRLWVLGDRDHVFRAVYNLVDNAVKFTAQGGRLILRAQAHGTMCDFSITNTGTGIAPEDIPHIFDRFYKADRSRSLDKTGAGLGLYIVKNIINLHGGDISVRSDGGETEFSFTLPISSAQR